MTPQVITAAVDSTVKMGHTDAFHAAMVADAAVWASLLSIGIQNLPAFGDEPEENLELRNCACGSTLAKEIV